MTFTLSNNVKIGEKIKTSSGWEKITCISKTGIETKSRTVNFGDIVYGWKKS